MYKCEEMRFEKIYKIYRNSYYGTQHNGWNYCSIYKKKQRD